MPEAEEVEEVEEADALEETRVNNLDRFEELMDELDALKQKTKDYEGAADRAIRAGHRSFRWRNISMDRDARSESRTPEKTKRSTVKDE